MEHASASPLHSLTWCILIAEENQYIVTCIFIFAFCVCFIIHKKKGKVFVLSLFLYCVQHVHTVTFNYAVHRSIFIEITLVIGEGAVSVFSAMDFASVNSVTLAI